MKQQPFLSRNLLPIVLVFIAVVVTVVSSNLHWGGDRHWKGIVEADARGYYAYLPAVFIYHDLNFRFADSIEKGKYEGAYYYEYRIGSPSGKVINKYYCGTALAQAPFFLAAHLLAPLVGDDADGYSKIYMVFVNLAAIFYLILGLIFLSKTLTHLGISGINRSLTLLTIVFGTNLFYYTIGEPGMSHVYSFAFVGWWLLIACRLIGGGPLQLVVLLGAITGIIVLIRPVNGLIVLTIPFLAGDWKGLVSLFNRIFSHWVILAAGVVFVAVAMIQPLIYNHSTGLWWVYSYGEEGFHFLSPHITDFLFSYKKGFFVYTPLSLLIFGGAVFIWYRKPFALTSYLIFWAVVTYVFASWWNWWYGGSFSTRVFTEFLPVLAIPLASLLHHLSGRRRAWLIAVMVILVVVCQIQTYQYRYTLIHWEEMDFERYWAVFLRIDLLF